MERDDGANLFVLEAVLVALLILGAAIGIQAFQVPARDNGRPQAEMERLIRDAIVVLAGLEDGNGTKLLDHYVAEAMHCALRATPPVTDCDGARSRNLSLKLESYLPPGGGYALVLGNSAASRELYRSPLPQGEAVAAGRSIATEWNATFLATEFSCYEAGVDANATLVPVDRGRMAWARAANVTIGSTVFVGAPASTPRVWNVTLPSATRPPASDALVANVSANATLPGTAEYASCDLSGATAALRTAIRATPFSVTHAAPPIASYVTFSADLASLQAVPGATVGAPSVTIYELIPPRGKGLTAYIETGTVALTGSPVATGEWRVPPASLYGAHPALLRVPVTVGGVEVELRRVLVLEFALLTGEVPIDPPYRVSLQAWLPDWR